MGSCCGKTTKIHRAKYTNNSGKILNETYYMDTKPIGEGAFAKVYKGYLLSNISQKVAIKKVDKTRLGRDDLKAIGDEITVLQRLSHPNILKYIDSIEDRKHMCIVTEFIEGTTLAELMSTFGKFTEFETANIAFQIASAIAHWHQKNISHRDIKPDNIIINDDMKATLIDFGLSKIRTNICFTSMIGSPWYMSPEVFEGKYGSKCDVWSLGVLIYKMISGTFPFNGSSLKEIKNDIFSRTLEFNDKIWKQITPIWIDLLKRMLVVDPNKRISASGVLKHKWFKKSGEDSIQFDTIHSTKNIFESSIKISRIENKREQYHDLVEGDTVNIFINIIERNI